MIWDCEEEQEIIDCFDCRGEGKNGKEKCTLCNGRGYFEFSQSEVDREVKDLHGMRNGNGKRQRLSLLQKLLFDKN